MSSPADPSRSASPTPKNRTKARVKDRAKLQAACDTKQHRSFLFKLYYLLFPRYINGMVFKHKDTYEMLPVIPFQYTPIPARHDLYRVRYINVFGLWIILSQELLQSEHALATRPLDKDPDDHSPTFYQG